MYRPRFVFGILVLSIFIQVTLRAQQTEPSNAESTMIDSTTMVNQWPGQPIVTLLTMRSSLMAVVKDVHRSTWNTNLEDSMDNSTPRGLRIVKSVGFGILGAGVGFGLGSLIVGITSHPHGEDAGLAFLAGGAIGVPILMPIGVHLGNESRGNLALDYLLPLAASAGGALLLYTSHPNGLSPFIILGVVYFATTVLTEQLVGQ